jgi:very-short-patch-repair endonuclease
MLEMGSAETVRARQLRGDMSGTERLVWSRLRRKQIAGKKFRRQLSIGPYFADFVCLSARLVVEVDGPFHKGDSDARKTAYLESQGFRVVRFSVADVDASLEDVIEAIFLHVT